MSRSPLRVPEVPSYYRLPDDLEEHLTAALAQQAAAAATLAASKTPDPSFAQFLGETWLEISLAAAKLASSYAVCQVQDWLDEVEP